MDFWITGFSYLAHVPIHVTPHPTPQISNGFCSKCQKWSKVTSFTYDLQLLIDGKFEYKIFCLQSYCWPSVRTCAYFDWYQCCALLHIHLMTTICMITITLWDNHFITILQLCIPCIMTESRHYIPCHRVLVWKIIIPIKTINTIFLLHGINIGDPNKCLGSKPTAISSSCLYTCEIS